MPYLVSILTTSTILTSNYRHPILIVVVGGKIVRLRKYLPLLRESVDPILTNIHFSKMKLLPNTLIKIILNVQ